MPGMIDTHRHMWQTAMRGVRRRLDAHAVLRLVLPRARQDLPPRGHPRGQPARPPGSRSTPASPPPSTGRTGCRASTTPRPRSTRCSAVPGRFVLAYGNIQAGPVGVDRRPGGARVPRAAAGRAGDSSACSSPSTSPATRPSRSGRAFEVARELGLAVTTHAGVWGATNDDGIRLMHENGFMTPQNIYVHAATLTPTRTSGSPRPAARSRSPPSPSRAPARATRPPGRCAATTSRCRCRWTPASGGAATCSRAMRTTLGADRAREHLEAHVEGRHRDPQPPAGRARRRLGHPRRRPARSAATTSAASSRARRPTWC